MLRSPENIRIHRRFDAGRSGTVYPLVAPVRFR